MLLQPELLEEVIVCVCLKQHGLESALRLLGQSTERPKMEENKTLLDAIFTRINALERRLQVSVCVCVCVCLCMCVCVCACVYDLNIIII